MNKWSLFIATILLLSSSVARAGDLEDAAEAYKKGNYDKAVELLRPLASQGGTTAQNRLGAIYEHGGEGITQDYQEAVKWYRLAAEQGDAVAQYNLGGMYANGEGVTQNYQEAMKWFRLAAVQGNAAAQNNLGGMYAKGEAVIKDYVRAHMWFNLAASNGNKNGNESRAIIAKRMTPSQIAKAQKMALDCEKNNYKNCK